MSRKRSFVLVTGSTGLLGQYLLRDLLLRDADVAVIVRPTRTADARSRVDSVIDRWERLAGRSLKRPVVLAGNLAAPGLGLAADQRRWLNRCCAAVLHNAASLSFVTGGPRNEEPWLGNVGGTTNVVELARETGIPQFHQVSTAYVCGLRTGRILEQDLDCRQTFGNDYEASKLEAEQIVRAAGFPKPPTILRPAIIVGDSRTSYTSTFHGFYTPLRVMTALLPTLAGLPPIPESLWMAALGLTGGEGKNLVPVDWVSRVVTHIVDQSQWHGRTYHLTPGNRVPVREIAAVTRESIMARFQRGTGDAAGKPSGPAAGLPERFAETFREQMATYAAYWRDDPEFDTTNTTMAAADLPCPVVDAAMLRRLCDFAIEANFGWPRPQVPAAAFDVERDLANGLAPTGQLAAADPVRLEVSGSGGGIWSLDPSELWPAIGRPEPGNTRIRLSSETLNAIRQGTLSAADAFRGGRLAVFAAQPATAADLVAAVQRLTGRKEATA